jgi:hypothetical protein
MVFMSVILSGGGLEPEPFRSCVPAPRLIPGRCFDGLSKAGVKGLVHSENGLVQMNQNG